MRYSVKSKKVVPLLMMGFVLFNGVDCRANQDDTDGLMNYEMETIYVTGEKITAMETKIANKTVIDVKEKIDAGQINSVGDLLRDVAGVTVQNTSGGTRVTMRGLSDERFVVAVNGNVQTNPGPMAGRYNLEWDMIPVSNIQKIEIIRGASSTAYPGTWGGVINLVTVQQPGDNRTDFKVSYGDFDTHKYSFMHQGSTENGRSYWNMNAGKRETDGYNCNTWQESEDFSTNFNYLLNDKQKLLVGWAYNKKEQGVLDYPGQYERWKTNNYSVNYNTDSTELRLSRHEQNYDTNRFANKYTERDITNQGFTWQQLLHKNNHNITYGLQYQHLDFDISPANMKSQVNSFFIQDNWQIKPDVTIGLGARYDHSNVDLNSTLNPWSGSQGKPYSCSNSQLSPKLSITKTINNDEEVFVSAGSVFRPPTVGEYFHWGYVYFEDWSNTSASKKLANDIGLTTQQEWQQQLGILQPEKGWSYELGWRKQVNDRIGWQVTGFYNSIDNYIYQSYPKAIQKGYTSKQIMRNVDNVINKGVELSFNYTFNTRMSGAVSFTRQISTKDPESFDPSTNLSSIPENTLNIGFKYKAGKVCTALDTRYVSSYSGMGGAATTDLSFMVENKDSVAALAIRNIFDKDYKDEDGSSMPGINYSVSWQYKI